MSLFSQKKKCSLSLMAFLQATGLAVYCALIGLLFWKGNQLFGSMHRYFGPVLFLILFVVSALICALLSLGYPIFLFWEKKQTTEALKLVAHTSAWLIIYLLALMIILIVF